MIKFNLLLLGLLLPVLCFSAETKGFFVVGEAGSTELSSTSVSTKSVSSVTSNSYNLGLGYEVDKWSVEYTFGSAGYVSSTVGKVTTTVDLTNWTFVVNYKILNSGNFRPFIGFGSYGGTVNLTGNSSEDYSRNIWNAGFEIPLDNSSTVRLKYFKSVQDTKYVGFSGFSAGLMYRF